MTAIPWSPDGVGVGTEAGTARPWPVDPWSVGMAALAAGLVAMGIALGWRGSDLPAQIFRVEAIRHHGFALWDSQWFGGHWMLGYSVLEPLIGAAIGLSALCVVGAAVAAAGFHRLAADHFGTGAARAASVVFAVSTIVETAIGQIPFLAGEAVGLWCLVALARRRPASAALAAALASLLSPLAGAFVALAVGAVAVTTWWPRSTRLAARLRRPGSGTAVAALLGVGVPLGAVGLLFPGQGPMPFSAVDCGWDLLIALLLLAVLPLAERTLRTGVALFCVVAVASLAIPSALGGNVGRIEDCVALPLAVALLWDRRRWLIPLAAIPLIASQWAPAWSDMTSDAGHAWRQPSYYQPVIDYLHRVMGPGGRVEVVPTADHWEAAYVAPSVALARGWERQLDVADNPIFYEPGQLSAASYLAWLLDNGVRYVALPSTPLDYAGQAEGRLVAAGVPGLDPVWHTAAWQVYAVDGATGIVSGPGYLSHIDGSKMTVVARHPGAILVRVHDNPGWRVADGNALLQPSPQGWIVIYDILPGPLQLTLGLSVP